MYKQFMVYFYDNTNTDPRRTVEQMVVEAEDCFHAEDVFHRQTNYECSVRSVDEYLS